MTMSSMTLQKLYFQKKSASSDVPKNARNQPNCWILRSAISLEGINRYCKELIVEEKWHLSLPLLVTFGQLCLSSIPIAGFFDLQYLWKESINVFVFCMQIIIKGRWLLRQSLLVGFGQLYFFFNQVPRFFDHHYPWKESTDIWYLFTINLIIVDFLHENSHQGKVAFETINCSWMWQGASFANQIVGFFDYQNLWKESIVILIFLQRDNNQGKVAFENTFFG